MRRNGILAAGNFIVDRVKVIESYPDEEQLSSILREQQANGGGSYNVLKDLAAMGAEFPLHALGLVGDDADGSWILQDCANAGINTDLLVKSPLASTSYTDVMSVESTGKRTFFHQRGANKHLIMDEIDFSQTEASLFHLAYLMLLDKQDEFVSKDRTLASTVLERAQEAGMITSVDLVSTPHPQFGAIARSAMPFTNYFIANEVEAGWILDQPLDASSLDNIVEAALELQHGYDRMNVVLHCREGAVVVDHDSQIWYQNALKLPDDFVRGSVGAGDAFAAGFLHGIHEKWPIQECLRLAVCTAASSLSDETPSAGVRNIKDCLALGEKYIS